MLLIHFPCVEAGRVRPLCDAAQAHCDWTTDPEKVSCPRCKALVRSSAADDDRGSPRPASGADASAHAAR